MKAVPACHECAQYLWRRGEEPRCMRFTHDLDAPYDWARGRAERYVRIEVARGDPLKCGKWARLFERQPTLFERLAAVLR